MDAIVEVATATVALTAAKTTLIRLVSDAFSTVTIKVATFTKHVLSIAGTSISAVSPDYTLIGGTA